jgi:hypothetical protein
MYRAHWIDPRNKAYGLDYNTKEKPSYNKDSLLQLMSAAAVKKDSLRFYFNSK